MDYLLFAQGLPRFSLIHTNMGPLLKNFSQIFFPKNFRAKKFGPQTRFS